MGQLNPSYQPMHIVGDTEPTEPAAATAAETIVSLR